MLKKAYVRYREDLPDGHNLCAAADGFSRLGVQIVPFYGFGDVEAMNDLSFEACVAGFICDVNAAMDRMGRPRPELEDYPPELLPFMGRGFSRTTLGEVKSHPGVEVFVKPVQQKLFTGRIWDNSHETRIVLACYPDETPVYVSGVVKFVSEYRTFVLRREILDCRRYRGDWGVAPDRKVVEAAVAECPPSPVAFALDFGVTDDGRTLLVERNDATALGHYGLRPELYAQMMEARWLELAG